MITVEREADDKYTVFLDGEKYGTLVYTEKNRNGTEKEKPAWVFWDKDMQDGVDYSDGLLDTVATIQEEVTAYKE